MSKITNFTGVLILSVAFMGAVLAIGSAMGDEKQELEKDLIDLSKDKVEMEQRTEDIKNEIIALDGLLQGAQQRLGRTQQSILIKEAQIKHKTCYLASIKRDYNEPVQETTKTLCPEVFPNG